MVVDPGTIVTEATGPRTAMSADPSASSDVAMIVAEPGPTARTRPDGVTVAIDGSPLCQVTLRPVRAAPLSLLGVASSWTVAPGSSRPWAGSTVTEATESGGLASPGPAEQAAAPASMAPRRSQDGDGKAADIILLTSSG